MFSDCGKMDQLLLWVALAPPQVESLETRGLVPAGFTTNRIDLSKDSVPVGRPGDVHETGGEFSFWDYKLYQLEISALGYFRQMEANILVKMKDPREFAWYGSMLKEARDAEGVLMYRLIEPQSTVLPVGARVKVEKDTRN